MTKLRYALLALGAAAMLPTNAKQLTPAEALKAASLAPTSSTKMQAPSQYRLVKTIGSEDFNACYVFNRTNGGYAILSADDSVTPMLGYSDSGKIDPENMPDGLRYMLWQYEQEIRYAATHPEAAAKALAAKAPQDREPIAPLCETQWDQDAPYNLLCPVYNGKNAYTGCVATAAAQIMKVHNWPKKGTGSIRYTSSYQGQTSTVECDFSAHTYDWENMRPKYYGSGITDEQRMAVARLMADAGAASRMMYSTEASGSNSGAMGEGLINFLGYDKGMRFYDKCTYTISEYNSIAYSELAAGRPIYMSGSNSEGGHAFVGDGYSSDNFFHINWGWSGMSDGYYLLTLLDPEQQGIGGTHDGYTKGLSFIGNIKPAEAGSDYYYGVSCRGEFNTPSNMYRYSASVPFGTSGTTYINMSFLNLVGSFGIRMVDNATNEETYLWAGSSTDISPSAGVTRFSVMGVNFPKSGTYTATPVFRIKSNQEIINVRTDIAGPVALKIECNDYINITPIYAEGETKFTSMKPAGEFFIGYPMAFTTEATTTKPEYVGDIEVQVVNANKNLVAVSNESSQIIIEQGETVKTKWMVKMQYSSNITAGDYTMRLVDKKTSQVLGEFAMSIKANPGTLAYETATCVVEPGILKGNWGRSNPAIIDRNSTITVNIPITSGAIVDDIHLLFQSISSSVTSAQSKDSYIVSAGAGETVSLVFVDPFAPIQNDITYGLKVMGTSGTVYNGYTTSGRFFFKATGEIVGVEDVAANSEINVALYPNPATDAVVIEGNGIEEVNIYSLTGSMVKSVSTGKTNRLEVGIENLAGGHYIVNVVTSNGRTAKRLIKK